MNWAGCLRDKWQWKKRALLMFSWGKKACLWGPGIKKKPSFVDINYQVTVNQLQRRRNDLLSDVWGMSNGSLSWFSPFHSFFLFVSGWHFPLKTKTEWGKQSPFGLVSSPFGSPCCWATLSFEVTEEKLIVLVLCNFLLMGSASSVCAYKRLLDNLTITATQSGIEGPPLLLLVVAA